MGVTGGKTQNKEEEEHLEGKVMESAPMGSLPHCFHLEATDLTCSSNHHMTGLIFLKGS